MKSQVTLARLILFLCCDLLSCFFTAVLGILAFEPLRRLSFLFVWYCFCLFAYV